MSDGSPLSPEQQAERAQRFAALHESGRPLLMPNPWDVGSARLLAWLGFEALATTSSGFAATLGRLDGGVTRDQALAHAAQIAAATERPLSADLENGFGDDPAGVADTAAGAVTAGLSGFSIEDYTGNPDAPIYPVSEAAGRVSAAAEVAHAGPARLVLTARCENHIRGRVDLGDTIERLLAYQQAGADVLFAPGVVTPDDIGAIVEAVALPVSVLALKGAPPIPELAELGVARVSVGGAFAFAAAGAVVQAARELREQGTYGYLAGTAEGVKAVREAFG